MKILQKILIPFICLAVLTGCKSESTTNDKETVNNVTDTSVTEVADTSESDLSMKRVVFDELYLIDRYNRHSSVVADEAVIVEVAKAWQERERTYEKLMPAFEYAVKFSIDGEEQTWRVNKAGYCMQEGTNELYKMNTQALHAKMDAP